MSNDFGWRARQDILRRQAEISFVPLLRSHDWTAEVEDTPPGKEYVAISVSYGAHKHRIALLYSAGNDSIYKELATQFEHIFVNAPPYLSDRYTSDSSIPVHGRAEFLDILTRWNLGLSEELFVPENPEAEPRPEARRSPYLLLLSDDPLTAVWLRIRQFQSVVLSRRLLSTSSGGRNAIVDKDALTTKAEGVAYALRNADDYFESYRSGLNLSQRVLTLYYGSIAFVFAEMLARPTGPNTLAELEDATKNGHGLYTIDNPNNRVEDLVIVLNKAGLFPKWMRELGISTDFIAPKKSYKFDEIESLAPGSWATLERLFASIPELSDLFQDISSEPPRWAQPFYDPSLNAMHDRLGSPPSKKISYVTFIDNSGRMKKEHIAQLRAPIKQVRQGKPSDSGVAYVVALEHSDRTWQESLTIHRSPFIDSAVVLPILGVDAHRMVCVALLYALSIIVRYRPSIWRRIQEGDLDHIRILIDAFLGVVERVLPQSFLETITGQPVFARQPGALW